MACAHAKLTRPHRSKYLFRFAGQVGAVSCNMKSRNACIGDTLHLRRCSVEPLERFEAPKPMVFAGVYPMDQSQFASLQAAIDKLALNDSAVDITMESRYYRFTLLSNCSLSYVSFCDVRESLDSP